MYKVTIAGIAELTEEVIKVDFNSAIFGDSHARSSDIAATLTIQGRVAYGADKPFMKDSAKEIAKWSTVKPDSVDTYKAVSVVFDHMGLTRTYSLSHAFVVSFDERFEGQNGFFRLVIRQKKDRIDGVTVK
jgi:hypothetical protein